MILVAGLTLPELLYDFHDFHDFHENRENREIEAQISPVSFAKILTLDFPEFKAIDSQDISPHRHANHIQYN